MPNDVPDWTGLNQVNLVGSLSGTPLGDSAAPTLARDQVSDTITTTSAIYGFAQVLASLKPASGATIAQVGNAGALATGTATQVSPAFGQATTAGNHLLAEVFSPLGAGSAITTAAAGWSVLADSSVGGGVALWHKPNCGAAEAAPVFTCGAGGSTPMFAQLVEHSGVATSSSVDQVASGGTLSGTTVTITNPLPDAQFGDLVACAIGWLLFASAAATFADVYANQAAVVRLGDTGASSRTAHAVFGYGIIPPATIPAPVGIAAWDYDVQAVSAPAAGTVAQVTLAASATKIYRCARLAVSLSSTTAASHVPVAVLNDGSTTIWTAVMASAASIGAAEAIDTSNLAHKGTLNQNMLLGFNGNSAGGLQAASIGAYLR